MVAGVVLVIFGVAYVVISGIYVLPVDLNRLAREPVSWLNMSMTMAFSAGAIASAMGAFIRAVYGLLGDVHRQQLEISSQRDQIHYLATHDNLTGLLSLRHAVELSDRAIEDARRTGHLIACLFIDLDGFKAVNDQYGHDAGDAVLRIVAERLQGCVRSADVTARVGGDEFVVILAYLTHADVAGKIAEKIITAIAQPINYEHHTLEIGASIGIALFPDHAQDLDGLKKAADKAMYAVKTAGKNAYLFAGQSHANAYVHTPQSSQSLP